jgi:hypothetical protein
MDFSCDGTTTLCPGVFLLDGKDKENRAFRVNLGTVQMGTAGFEGCPTTSVNGVTIIATSSNGANGGGFEITGGTVVLSAPTTTAGMPAGLPSGLLFAQDPDHAYFHSGGQADSTITANGMTSLVGYLYTPATTATFVGNSNSSCFLIIAGTVGFVGNSMISGDKVACAATGVTGPSVLTTVLAE